MRGFKEAAEFIGQWIKVQKHMATVRNIIFLTESRILRMIFQLYLSELVLREAELLRTQRQPWYLPSVFTC
jgi:hypothetical protein